MERIELNNDEDKKFDHLIDVDQKTPAEAWEIIENDRRERSDSLGHETVNNVVDIAEQRKKHHYSRRGGRAYPEPSDSALDPYWNGLADHPSDYEETPESRAAFELLKQEALAAAIMAIARDQNISHTAAAALIRARHEIHTRR